MTWADEVEAHRQALDTSFAVFSRTPHGALLWLTTVISGHVITLDDDIAQAVAADIDAYHAERATVFKKSGKAYRNPAGWTRYCGTIEIDLIHPRIASRCSRMKAGLLAELGIDVTVLRADQRIALVHEHAVVDHRGHASADVLTRDMRAAWPGARRVHAARLYDTGTVAQNLSNLADYAGKFRFRYSMAWNGQKTTYLCDFEEPWREHMRRTYRAIGFARLLNGNVATQAGRRGMHTDPGAPRAESTPHKQVQLCVSPTMKKDEEHNHTNPSNPHTTIIRSSGDDGDIMRAHEIDTRYVNPERITAAALRELEDALAREGPGLKPDELGMMYGDEAEELQLQQQRLDLVKTRSDIDRLQAAAALDRAKAAHSAGTVRFTAE